MNQQTTLFSDNPEYDAFIAKFEHPKTTDDCYTPPLIYDVVRDWACAEYGIAQDKIVRPFYPGGDYKSYLYPVEAAKRIMDATGVPLADLVDVFADIPAADVVPVTRCRECKNSYEDLAGRICVYGPCVDCIVPDNFYCAYGARMDGGADDATD